MCHTSPNGSDNEYLSFLEDQESQASVVSEILVEDTSIKNAKPSEDGNSNMNQTCKDLGGYVSEDLQDTYYDEFNNSTRNESSTEECIPVNEFVKASGFSFSNLGRELNFTCLPNSCSSLSIADKDPDIGLKLELDAVEAQYRHWFQELSRMRDEELEATKRDGWQRKTWLFSDKDKLFYSSVLYSLLFIGFSSFKTRCYQFKPLASGARFFWAVVYPA
ncbi:hypothetical protein GQ457_08G022410 [Hibiscus cannabinus]